MGKECPTRAGAVCKGGIMFNFSARYQRKMHRRAAEKMNRDSSKKNRWTLDKATPL